MSKRATKRPTKDLLAGEAFRNSMVSRADVQGFAPLWYGWVIMEAFLAGVDYARAQQPPSSE